METLLGAIYKKYEKKDTTRGEAQTIRVAKGFAEHSQSPTTHFVNAEGKESEERNRTTPGNRI